MFERFVDSFPDVITGDREYVRYEPNGATGMPIHVEMQGDILTVAQTYEQNGDLMYDPRIDFKVDYENRKVIPVSFENSGSAVYQEFDISDGTPETMKAINSVLTFADDWMDEIDSQGFSAPGGDDEPVQNRNIESR